VAWHRKVSFTNRSRTPGSSLKEKAKSRAAENDVGAKIKRIKSETTSNNQDGDARLICDLPLRFIS